ncbi:MAG: hypothetical protein JXB05_02755 [Myxococcaceae bacterium]|nr:hypothetical protein [Myxococcaceae bacterium]
MLLFGAGGQLYASHIPMFGRPHDMQVLLVVTLEHPKLPADRDFSDGTYTLRPERFDLDELVAGRLKRFRATIYRGNFEAEGEPVYTDATVQVEGVAHAQPLMAETQAHAEPLYWVLNEGCGVYLVHALSSAPDFDQVVKVSLGRPVPRSGEGLTMLRLPGRKNASTERLRAGERLTAMRADGTACRSRWSGSCRTCPVRTSHLPAPEEPPASVSSLGPQAPHRAWPRATLPGGTAGRASGSRDLSGT